MTTLTYAIRRQVTRTLDSPRRLLVVVLLLTIVAAAGIATMMERAPQAINYHNPYPLATPAELCPGDTFTYPVQIDIKQGNSISRVTEGWCNRETGICPNALQADPMYYNFIVPYSVNATATRTAPAELTPGSWEFRHCNETHSDNLINVICYAVEVTVKDCPAP